MYFYFYSVYVLIRRLMKSSNLILLIRVYLLRGCMVHYSCFFDRKRRRRKEVNYVPFST